jgi:predicted DNA-binding transcriptional regulator AlpA
MFSNELSLNPEQYPNSLEGIPSSDFAQSKITFNDMPQALAYLIRKVDKLETLLNESMSENCQVSDRWFNLQELCQYLPDRPARQTVYGWIGQKLIPYHKKGKKLQFLKSEIDNWLKSEKRKCLAEIQAEAEQFILAKKGGRK